MRQRHVFGTVFTLETAIAGLVFVVILGLLGYVLIRRRATAVTGPSQRTGRPRLEAYYVGVLVAFAAFLVAWTAWQNHREHDAPASKPLRLDVTAFQWCWNFRYPHTPGHPGATGTCRGSDLPTLVVPTGRPVEVRLTSRDVIHSFWVPDLRYKMDAFPDHVNSFTLTFDKAGRWKGRCAEFCGERHATMDFLIKAVPPKEYDRWAHSHATEAPA
jgi:cytochrome c oxidase subunit II